MDWTESVIVLAFAMGLLSACSLPLGTLTTLLWTPGDRAVADLMAFGGGALLAALAIDLVGSALDRGHFFALAGGCVVGGLLFRVLNDIINNKGGFLRKSSTVILHLQRRRRERLAKALTGLRRVSIFAGLAEEPLEQLSGRAVSLKLGANATLYRAQDPSERIYVIEEGAFRLLDPARNMAALQNLGAGDAFGHLGTLTGAPRASFAAAAEPTTLWVIPKDAIEETLHASPDLADHLEAFLQGEPVGDYLQDR